MDNESNNTILQKARHLASTKKVCALAVLTPDETPYVAAMHYSYDDDLSSWYFSTDAESKKFAVLKANATAPAAIALGLDDDDSVFLQMTGVLFDATEQARDVSERHYARNPSSAEFANLPTTRILRFEPTSARLTDYGSDPFQLDLEFDSGRRRS
jgi:general stress protein 26